MFLNKEKVGYILGITSIVLVIISIIMFYVQRGPNVDIDFVVTIYSIFSIIGILLAIISSIISKRRSIRSIGIIGFIANGFVLCCAYLLLLAMGIGEP